MASHKILIIEDELSLQQALKEKLNMSGFAVITATNGKEGLKKALEEHPQLIILDVLMPKMDGMTMLRELRNDVWGAEVPVIVLTNKNADDEIVTQIVDDQPAYYLIKSDTSLHDIIEKVKSIILAQN